MRGEGLLHQTFVGSEEGLSGRLRSVGEESILPALPFNCSQYCEAELGHIDVWGVAACRPETTVFSFFDWWDLSRHGPLLAEEGVPGYLVDVTSLDPLQVVNLDEKGVLGEEEDWNILNLWRI